MSLFLKRTPIGRGHAFRAFSIAFVLLALVLLAAPQARADAKPRKGDTVGPMSKNVHFKTSVDPAEAKSGDTVTFKVAAQVDPPWHIYKYAKEQPGDGPRATQFDLFDTDGLKPAGDWTASREAVKKKEEVFKNLPFVEYYENEVTWSIKLQVPPGTEPGKKTLRCQIYFQMCSSGPGGSCTIPGRWTLAPATVTVVPGGVAASDSSSTRAAGPQQPEVASREAAAPPAQPTVGSAPPASSVQATRETPAGAASAPTNEAQQALQKGLWAFLLLAAGGGLMALVTPCVWPMVPVTVNFFVKQGQTNRRKTVVLAVTYCLSIIAVFTLVGVLFSALFGGAYLQRLANAAWLNLAVAALFIAFGLSLLGLFEFRLPSFLLNASAQGESRGGYIGVVFMALTLTITSFTCTFPVVGALLVMAAGGSALYPVIGLATFAAVLALPFFVLALAPGLTSHIPRSGDWMNAVKVVGGLIEIGAAFKFINTAECAYVVPEDAWFNAPVVLTIWIALCFVCGIYLLGLFKTSHDHADLKVGPGRILTGSLFVALGLYLMPALFGHPPQGMIWDRLVKATLPADAGKAFQSAVVVNDAPGNPDACREVRATSTDPKAAEREERKCHGVSWGMSLEAAIEEAKSNQKPVLIDFTGVNCANCRLMEENVMPKPEVVSLLKSYVTIQLYTDYVPIRSISADDREKLAEANQVRLKDLANEATNPFYVVLSPDGKVLEKIGGYNDPPVFAEFLKRGLAMQQGAKAVAQADAPLGR
jgi:thiol:disulfide interchange protein DsbD